MCLHACCGSVLPWPVEYTDGTDCHRWQHRGMSGLRCPPVEAQHTNQCPQGKALSVVVVAKQLHGGCCGDGEARQRKVTCPWVVMVGGAEVFGYLHQHPSEQTALKKVGQEQQIKQNHQDNLEDTCGVRPNNKSCVGVWCSRCAHGLDPGK